MKVISPIGALMIRGPTSWYLEGSRSIQTLAGSTTWSSTETILGSSAMEASIARDLTACQLGEGGYGTSSAETGSRTTMTSSAPLVAMERAATTMSATAMSTGSLSRLVSVGASCGDAVVGAAGAATVDGAASATGRSRANTPWAGSTADADAVPTATSTGAASATGSSSGEGSGVTGASRTSGPWSSDTISVSS